MLSVKYDGHELSDYLIVTSGFDRGIGSDYSPTLEKIGEGIGKNFVFTTQNEKTISMPFVLRYDLINKRRTLAGILNVKEPKELIFGDEPDKVYYALPTGDVGVDENVFLGKGTINWIVPDGLAHSVAEKTFKGAVSSDGILEIEIQNDGTEDVPISYEITNNQENGYLGFVSQYGVAQIGNAEEIDGDYSKSDWVINDDTSADLLNNWTTGQGYLTEDFTKAGSWSGQTFTDKTTRQYIVPTFVRNNGWSVATKYRKFGADSQGNVGAASFTTTARLWFANSAVGQAGFQGIILANADGTKRIGFMVHKYSKSNNLAYLKIYYSGDVSTGDDVRETFNMGQNTYTAWGSGILQIKKNGGKIEISLGSKKWTANRNELKDVVFDNVTIFSAVHGTSPQVTRMNWDYVKVQVHGVYNDIVNSQASGSKISVIDGVKYLYNPNGDESSDDPLTLSDVIGSEWFKAPPGITKVQIYYSDFVTVPPTAKAIIREAWT